MQRHSLDPRMRLRSPRVLTMPLAQHAPSPTFHSEPIERSPAVLFFALCALVFAAPLAMGAVFDWAVFALEIGATVIFLLWVARHVTIAIEPIIWNPIFAPALLFGAVIAAQLLFHTSAVTFLTRNESLKYAAYGLLVFVATQVVRSETEYRRLAVIAIVFGFAVALFGIVQDLTSNGRVYWFYHPSNPSHLFGPYVNRNHFAGLMELLAPLPLLIAVLLKPIAPVMRALIGFSGIIMASSIVLSLSRGGMLALGVEILLLAVYLASRRAWKSALTLGGACVLIAAFLWWAGSQKVMQRLSSGDVGGMSAQARLRITRSAIDMTRQRPWLGWGLGTFSTVYRPFRDFYGDRYVNEAHNDYAQFAAETGIAGIIAMVWLMIVLARAARRCGKNAPTNLSDAIRLGLLLGCVGLLVHSLVDFNLQIPANAALFYVWAALAANRTEMRLFEQRGLLEFGRVGQLLW